MVFNNGGYGMQRIFEDGGFNDLTGWDYTRIADLVGGGKALRADSPETLDRALQQARAWRSDFSFTLSSWASPPLGAAERDSGLDSSLAMAPTDDIARFSRSAGIGAWAPCWP